MNHDEDRSWCEVDTYDNADETGQTGIVVMVCMLIISFVCGTLTGLWIAT